MKKLPLHIKILVAFIIILTTYSAIKNVYKSATTFYNSVKTYEFTYSQFVQEQITVFDNNYLIFKDKTNITNLNKETFVLVTQIIFENRADGENVAWKWLHENQQIDYTEFTKFYSDLSAFTRERFSENSAIEQRKQSICKSHNLLISTFPGIIFNYFFKFDELQYKEGFITPETEALFKKPE